MAPRCMAAYLAPEVKRVEYSGSSENADGSPRTLLAVKTMDIATRLVLVTPDEKRLQRRPMARDELEDHVASRYKSLVDGSKNVQPVPRIPTTPLARPGRANASPHDTINPLPRPCRLAEVDGRERGM